MCLSVGCGIYKVKYCKYYIVLYGLDLIVKLSVFFLFFSIVTFEYTDWSVCGATCICKDNLNLPLDKSA